MSIVTGKESRFTDAELGLLKGLFATDKELLFAIRKVMLQFPLSDHEKELVKNVRNEHTEALIRKVFYPTLDPNAPLFQLADLVQALGADIKELSPEGAWLFIKAKDIEMQYIDQQLRILFGSDEEPKITLAELGKLELDENPSKDEKDEVFIRVTARNFLLSFVDTHLYQMKYLAGKKEETIEETQKRLERDSTK